MPEVQAEDPAGRIERRGWAFDAGWRVFVHDGSRTQQVVLEEAALHDPTWAAEVGLDPDTVAFLREHPTPGCYNGTAGPK